MVSQQVNAKRFIALVIDDLNGGGAEKVILELASGFVCAGHDVTVLTLGHHCDYPIPQGVKLSHLYTQKRSKLTHGYRIAQTVDDVQAWFESQKLTNGCAFDLVLSNLEDSHRILTRLTLKNLYFVVHNALEVELQFQRKPLFSWFKRVDYDLRGKRLVCVSKGIEQRILASYLKPEFITTIYNPVPVAPLQQMAAEEDPAIPASPYIVHVGRVARQKRHDILFQAFAKLTTEHKLVLLCNNPKKAQKLAQKYGVGERVIIPGFQQNPYNWIANAELLVLSSDFEGFGMVLAEALVVGTPCVSTDCHYGPAEILAEQPDYCLVSVGDPQALAQSMGRALNENLAVSPAKIIPQLATDYVISRYLELCE